MLSNERERLLIDDHIEKKLIVKESGKEIFVFF